MALLELHPIKQAEYLLSCGAPRAGNVSDETEVNHSLMYCTRHSIRDNSVPHRRPLMERGLLQRWREHYAKKFSHLLSSQAILAAVGLLLANAGPCAVCYFACLLGSDAPGGMTTMAGVRHARAVEGVPFLGRGWLKEQPASKLGFQKILDSLGYT